MNDLQLVKSSRFGDVECDIYYDNDEMYMTAGQLGRCLGYSEPVIAINKIAERNPYLKNPEFSVVTKLVSTDGKYYNTRVFSEDGIYEVAFLSKTEIARQFRMWVRKLLKSIRSGETAIVKTDKLEEMKIRAAADRAAAMKINAENRRLTLFMDNADLKELSIVAKAAWVIKATEKAMGSEAAKLDLFKHSKALLSVLAESKPVK